MLGFLSAFFTPAILMVLMLVALCFVLIYACISHIERIEKRLSEFPKSDEKEGSEP